MSKNRFSNLKIGTKLTLSFTLIALVAAIIGVFGIISIRLLSERSEQMYTQNTQPVASLEKMAVYFQRTRVNMLRIILNKNAEEQTKYLDRLNSFEVFVNEGMSEYGAAHPDDAQYTSLINELGTYRTVRQQVIDLAMAGKQAESYQYSIDHELDAATAVNNILDKMFEANVTQAAALQVTSTKSAELVFIISLVLVGVGIASAIIIGILITRSIVWPTRKLITAAESLIIGDVEIAIHAESLDELGTLMGAFDRLIENIRSQAHVAEKIADGDLTIKVPVRSDKDLLGKKLQEMVMHNNDLLININSSSQQVTMGAENVANSSMSLAQGATEQASAIEQLSATVEAIAGQTRNNANRAGEAKSLSEKVKSGADGGTNHVEDLLISMEDIRSSSQSISKIISVIENIAFQTNILALNAAVEAARAGEHGKGFAVVASEVKTLADKSAKAAKEVTDIIQMSTKNVQRGLSIAMTTSESLNAIASEVGQVSGLISEISEASHDQADSLAQVKLAIHQVAEVITNNSSLTESTAAASEELSGQAYMLLEMVGQYKLNDNVRQYALTT